VFVFFFSFVFPLYLSHSTKGTKKKKERKKKKKSQKKRFGFNREERKKGKSYFIKKKPMMKKYIPREAELLSGPGMRKTRRLYEKEKKYAHTQKSFSFLSCKKIFLFLYAD
jgi:hypothetical protein